MNFLKSWHPYFWIFLIGFFLYARTLSFDYVYLDDTLLVSESYEFLKNPSNILKSFQQEVFTSADRGNGIFYRPMLTLSFLLDAQIGGQSLFVYHVTNILLHIFASMLIFRLLIALAYSRLLSFFLALVFTVHPIATQAIAWIPGRNDTLLAAFVFLSFLFFHYALQGHDFKDYILHLFFFALAVFTKETALVLPILYIFYIYVKKEKPLIFFLNKKRRASVLLAAGGWIFISFVLISFRSTFINNPNSYSIEDSLRNITLQLPGIFVYLGKLFFPVSLSVYPDLKDSTLIYGIAAFIILAILIFLLRQKPKRWRNIVFGIAWFLLFLLPTFIIREKYSNGILREHRAYIPFFGIFIILAEIHYGLVKNGSMVKWLHNKTIAYFSPLFLSVIFLLSFRTYLHSGNFRDGLSFWTNAVETSPSSPIAYINLGASYERFNDLDRAEGSYKKALELAPDLIGGHNNLGVIYMRKNKIHEAKEEFEKELARDPDFEMAKRNLQLLDGLSP